MHDIRCHVQWSVDGPNYLEPLRHLLQLSAMASKKNKRLIPAEEADVAALMAATEMVLEEYGTRDLGALLKDRICVFGNDPLRKHVFSQTCVFTPRSSQHCDVLWSLICAFTNMTIHFVAQEIQSQVTWRTAPNSSVMSKFHMLAYHFVCKARLALCEIVVKRHYILFSSFLCSHLHVLTRASFALTCACTHTYMCSRRVSIVDLCAVLGCV